jgi:sugar O-acyltransferase (sialic acid O-acetyltransferase NeuD family)
MKPKELLLIGAGGHAKSCIDIIESKGDYSIAHIIGQESEIGLSILGHTVRYSDADLARLRNEYEYAFIAVGQIHSPATRKKLHLSLSVLGYSFATIISKSAVVSRYARIGSGSIVMNGVILNADCTIGDNVILNSGSIIEHDVFIGDNCHVSTGVTINGGSKIGEGTFLGSGTVVRDGIEIGDNSFIGMTSVVTKNLSSGTILKANF